ncbi:hypothetical protein QYE76_060694 [Lolium multiflorum]|uniref:Uncharacterized protein n=1 Tax=Lolium multiflorum TaxID=4521 RepID=A0AAD8W6I3_LOLMU|nr:hypothetical protein QYE76_060694 [Lolium multiflorum]
MLAPAPAALAQPRPGCSSPEFSRIPARRIAKAIPHAVAWRKTSRPALSYHGGGCVATTYVDIASFVSVTSTGLTDDDDDDDAGSAHGKELCRAKAHGNVHVRTAKPLCRTAKKPCTAKAVDKVSAARTARDSLLHTHTHARLFPARRAGTPPRPRRTIDLSAAAARRCASSPLFRCCCFARPAAPRRCCSATAAAPRPRPLLLPRLALPRRCRSAAAVAPPPLPLPGRGRCCSPAAAAHPQLPAPHPHLPLLLTRRRPEPRLFMTEDTAQQMRWAVEGIRPDSGKMIHPSDGTAWKNFVKKYPLKAGDPRSVAIAISTDGFNPYGPGKNMNVYLEPLIDDLLLGWEDRGIRTYDAAKKEHFDMYVWYHTSLARALFCGWCTHGKWPCPDVQAVTFFWLNKGGKYSCFDEAQFLEQNHEYRSDVKSFKKGRVVHAPKPIPKTGQETKAELDALQPSPDGNGFLGYGETHQWTHKPCFWKLPYFEFLELPHNIDATPPNKDDYRRVDPSTRTDDFYQEEGLPGHFTIDLSAVVDNMVVDDEQEEDAVMEEDNEEYEAEDVCAVEDLSLLEAFKAGIDLDPNGPPPGFIDDYWFAEPDDDETCGPNTDVDIGY